MARPGITLTEVANAKASLIAEQQPITIDNIRQILGTGSRTTISRHLKQLNESGTALMNAEHAFPQPLVESLGSIWKTVQAEATQRIENAEQAAQEKFDELEAKHMATLSELSEANKTIASLQTNLENAEEQIVTMTSSMQQQSNQLFEQAGKLEAVTSANSHLQQTVKAMHEQVQILQTAREHYQEKVDEQRLVRELQHETAIKEQQGKINNLREEIQVMQKQAQFLIEEKESLQHLVGQSEKQVDEQMQQLKQLTAELEKVQSEKMAVQSALESIEKQKIDVEKLLVKEMDQNAMLKQKIGHLDEVIAQKNQHLKLSENTISQLSNDKQSLQQQLVKLTQLLSDSRKSSPSQASASQDED